MNKGIVARISRVVDYKGLGGQVAFSITLFTLKELLGFEKELILGKAVEFLKT